MTKRTQVLLWILAILSAAICGGYVLYAIISVIIQLAK